MRCTIVPVLNPPMCSKKGVWEHCFHTRFNVMGVYDQYPLYRLQAASKCLGQMICVKVVLLVNSQILVECETELCCCCKPGIILYKGILFVFLLLCSNTAFCDFSSWIQLHISFSTCLSSRSFCFHILCSFKAVILI